MRVLRVEHLKSGQGPYTHGTYDSLEAVPWDLLQRCYSPISNPEPELDGLGHVQGWCFGFKDEEQLTDWFSEAMLRALVHRYNFVVAEYEVPAAYIQYGDKQVAFLKEYATKVGEVVY